MTPNKFTIQILQEYNEIETIRNDWENLFILQNHREINAEFEHFLTVISNRKQTLKPQVLIIYRNDKIAGIVAGRIDKELLDCSIGYLHIFKPVVTQYTIIYGGILLDNYNDKELCEAIISGVCKIFYKEKIEIIFFNMIRNDTLLYQLILKAVPFFQKDYICTCQRHWVIDIFGTYSEWLSTISRSWVKKLKKKIIFLDRDFGAKPVIREYFSETDIETLLLDTEQIARKTYQRGMAVGFKSDTLTLERIRLAARKGWLHSFVLYINDTPVAYQHGFIFQNIFYANGRGYDPAFKIYSPGHQLFLYALEKVQISERIEMWDFGIGDALHKDFLGSRYWEETSIRIFAPSFRGLMLNLMWTCVSITAKLLEMIAWRLSLTKNIKKLWRQKLVPRNQQDPMHLQQ